MKREIAMKRDLLGRKVYMFLMEEMKKGDIKLIVNENSVTDKVTFDSDKGKMRKFIAKLNDKHDLGIFWASKETQNEIMLGVMDAFKAVRIKPVDREEKSFVWNLVDGSRKVENATVYTYKQLKYKECIVLG